MQSLYTGHIDVRMISKTGSKKKFMIKDHTIQNGMEFIKHFYIVIFTETVKILIQLI